ncbi:hypothetical protein [Spirillospora sp. CA-128828]|uniref:hypothetical protein n=1 Tax=Spirillospora sp. CA-128828 TaxID=3240033 RepID=UPI003D8A8D12
MAEQTTTLLPDDGEERPRPGASLRAAARQSRPLLIAIGVAIALLLAFGIWTAVSPHSGTADGRSTERGSGSPSAEAGPRRVVDGVPVGYAHTQPGAVAAAVHYQLARSRPTYITDASLRHTVLGHVMAASSLQTQRASDDANADAAMKALGLTPAGQGPQGARWLQHSAPLGVQVAFYSGQAVTVNVWMAESAGVVGDPATVLPPSGSYTTYVLTLVWERGDWRIASIATRPGPVPAASSNQRPSSQQDWQQSGRFAAPPPFS